MAHKVHPKIFRIKEISDWNSRGFYGKNLHEKLEEDFKIREFLRKRLKEAGVQRIEIERSPNEINIIINSTRPGIILGRGGTGVENLQKALKKEILIEKGPNEKAAPKRKEIKIEVREIKNPWSQASFVAQWVAQQIEKRIHHRRVLKQSLGKIITQKEVKGARIEISGRLNGAEIARREWLQKGSLPRQTIRADIDYAQEEAYCTYGVIGIKVWIYKGEKF
jgi:small subunit ribosomal protein S3